MVRLEDLDVAVQRRLQRRQEVVEDELRHLHEGRLHVELGVPLRDPEDVGELGDDRRRIDGGQGLHQVPEVAADLVPRGHVMRRPARRDVAARDGRCGCRWRRAGLHRVARRSAPGWPRRPPRRWRSRPRPALGAAVGPYVQATGVAGAHAAMLAATRPPPASAAPRRNPRRVRAGSSGAAGPNGSGRIGHGKAIGGAGRVGGDRRIRHGVHDADGAGGSPGCGGDIRPESPGPTGVAGRVVGGSRRCSPRPRVRSRLGSAAGGDHARR